MMTTLRLRKNENMYQSVVGGIFCGWTVQFRQTGGPWWTHGVYGTREAAVAEILKIRESEEETVSI